MTTNLERWRYFYKDIESPDLYVDWTFYMMISATLRRNVCLDNLPHDPIGRALYPNLYVIFIGPPGVGKSTSAYGALDLFKSFGGFERLENAGKRLITVAPNSLSLEQLYNYLNAHILIQDIPPQHITKNHEGKEIRKYLSSPLTFFATEELGTLFRENTGDLVRFITEGYDAGDFHRETKTQGVNFIKNMCIALLGCATPDWITEVSKNGLLKQGFASRTIFVWGGTKRHLRRKYEFTRDQQAELLKIKDHIRQLLKLYGPIRETKEAEEWMTSWYEKGGETNRLNKDRRLIDYYARKKVHLTKLAMVVHFADSLTSEVTVEDYVKALRLLDRTEPEMHLALLGTATENPAYLIVSKIEEKLEAAIQNNGGFVRRGELLLATYEYCKDGTTTFEDAITYLKDTGRIIERAGSTGKPVYKLVTNVESEVVGAT